VASFLGLLPGRGFFLSSFVSLGFARGDQADGSGLSVRKALTACSNRPGPGAATPCPPSASGQLTFRVGGSGKRSLPRVCLSAIGKLRRLRLPLPPVASTRRFDCHEALGRQMPPVHPYPPVSVRTRPGRIRPRPVRATGRRGAPDGGTKKCPGPAEFHLTCNRGRCMVLDKHMNGANMRNCKL